MKDRRFEWDPIKAEQNRRKHRVTFDEAMTAFFDELAIEALDVKHSNDEERRVLIGYSEKLRLLTVIYTQRNEKKRIITARRSTQNEEQSYALQDDSA